MQGCALLHRLFSHFLTLNTPVYTFYRIFSLKQEILNLVNNLNNSFVITILYTVEKLYVKSQSMFVPGHEVLLPLGKMSSGKVYWVLIMPQNYGHSSQTQTYVVQMPPYYRFKLKIALQQALLDFKNLTDKKNNIKQIIKYFNGFVIHIHSSIIYYLL